MKDQLNLLKARTIFYPTLAWNMLNGRWLKPRNWWDAIGPEIILGALPCQSAVGVASGGTTI